jgi:hypothetical protein
MQAESLITEILGSIPSPPTLVDIGASGAPPEIWTKIASFCNYVAFDPDSREFSEQRSSGFRRSIVINKAVTSFPASSTLPVYLTKSPYCSSTLKPAETSLENYLFADLFSVEQVAPLPCVDVATAIRDAQLESVDWVKIDTQGTDLRIWKSFPLPLRGNVLALDVEPGIINAYEEEDYFVDTHKALVEEGFWLSNLCIGSAIRMRPATTKRLEPGVSDAIAKLQRPSPAWTEARYLRTLEWMDLEGADAMRYRLLSAFALMDTQYGFALDTVSHYRRRFGEDEWSRKIWQQLQDWLVATADTQASVGHVGPWSSVRNLLGRFIPRCIRSCNTRG